MADRYVIEDPAPCLHCGGEARYKTRLLYGGEVRIECDRCGVSTKWYKATGPGESEKLAKRAWERRRDEAFS